MWFNAGGLGFAPWTVADQDVFVPVPGHPVQRVPLFDDEQRIAFDIEQGQKGPQAANVAPL